MVVEHSRPRIWPALLLLLVWAAACQAEGGSHVAIVQALVGDVTVTRGTAQPVAIAVGAVLCGDDRITTGPEARMALLFDDGSLVHLGPDTCVVLTDVLRTPPPPDDTNPPKIAGLLDALWGEIWGRLRPGTGAGTPTAVAGVVGTEIALKIARDGETVLTVLSGSVHFYNQYGRVLVRADQQSTARPGQAPTAPVTIGNAGILVEWTVDLQRAALPEELFRRTPLAPPSADDLARAAERARRHPDDAQARREYGVALYHAGRYAEAAREFERADGQADTLTWLGDALLAQGRLDEADRAYRAAAAREPHSVDAVLGTASVLLLRNRPAEAAKVIEGARVIDPAYPRVYLLQGVAASRLPGGAAAAREAWTRLRDDPAYRGQALALLALLDLAANNMPAARANAEAAVRAAPGSALAQGHLALVRLFAGDAAGAERAARRAQQADPNSVAAACVLGQVLLTRGGVREALDTLARATARDEGHVFARYLLGVAEAQYREYVHAEEDLLAVVRLAPDFIPAYDVLASVYIAEGAEMKARRLVDRVLAEHPDDPAAHLMAGRVYAQAGAYGDADAAYRRALDLQPDSARASAGLAELSLARGRFGDALRAARRAVYAAPNVAGFHALLGLCCEFNDLTSQAGDAYRAAIALDPAEALAKARLGLLDGNAHTTLNGMTQGLLLDPAVPRRFLQPGVDGEIRPRAGDGPGLSAVHQSGANAGATHTFALADLRHDGPDTLAGYLTHARSGAATLLGHLAYTGGRQTLSASGGLVPAAPDETLAMHATRALVATRRAWGRHTVWGSLAYLPSGSRLTDPDMQPTGYRTVAVQQRTWMPEVRLDLASGADTLSLGLGTIREEIETRRTLLADDTGRTVREVHTLYTQLSRPVTARGTLTVHLGLERREVRWTATAHDGPAGSTTDETLTWGGGGSYLTGGYLLRLLAGRVTDRSAHFALRPMETALALDRAVLPRGQADVAETTQVSIARRLAPGTFAQATLFQARVPRLTIGGEELPAAVPPQRTFDDVRRTGGSLRLEREVARHWYVNVDGVVSRTTQGTAVNGTTDTPYQPGLRASAELVYAGNGGLRMATRLRHVGAFGQDDPTAPNLPDYPARQYLDMSAAYALSPMREVRLGVTNLTDRPAIRYHGYPAGERQVELGITSRF